MLLVHSQYRQYKQLSLEINKAISHSVNQKHPPSTWAWEQEYRVSNTTVLTLKGRSGEDSKLIQDYSSLRQRQRPRCPHRDRTLRESLLPLSPQQFSFFKKSLLSTSLNCTIVNSLVSIMYSCYVRFRHWESWLNDTWGPITVLFQLLVILLLLQN